jgi:DNA-binding MarR family transcriptional regulator
MPDREQREPCEQSAPSPGVPGRPAEIEAVAKNVLDLLSTMRKSAARMEANSRSDVESATRLLLRTVAELGPMRTTALAERVHSDLSTVSRQTASLVTAGLLERRSDPADGRASVLALTPEGEAATAEHDRARADFYAQVLDGWTEDELRQFGALLARFTASYDQVHAARVLARSVKRPR